MDKLKISNSPFLSSSRGDILFNSISIPKKEIEQNQKQKDIKITITVIFILKSISQKQLKGVLELLFLLLL